jgi:hypothetical protein
VNACTVLQRLAAVVPRAPKDGRYWPSDHERRTWFFTLRTWSGAGKDAATFASNTERTQRDTSKAMAEWQGKPEGLEDRFKRIFDKQMPTCVRAIALRCSLAPLRSHRLTAPRP